MWLVTSWLTLLLLLPLDIILHSISSKMKRVWGVTAPPPAVRKALTSPGSRIPALLLFPHPHSGKSSCVKLRSSRGFLLGGVIISQGDTSDVRLSQSVLLQSSSQRSSSGHGCNSRGPGWQVWGIRWWCRYGKRTRRGTVYRTRYCNGRSGLMFGLIECEKWL